MTQQGTAERSTNNLVAKPPMTHVNLRVPEKHMEVVREAAEELELNQSDVIRLAVAEWVERRLRQDSNLRPTV